MLSAKYTDKSFDDLVNKRCKEHQLQKLHSRIGTSHLPIAQKSIFPQTARPPASGKEGEKSKSVKILNIRESPLYTGGLMTGKEPISAMNINFNVPLYFQMKATNIIPKKKSSSIETSTEDLFWKVAKGSQVKPDMIETGTAPNEELVYQNIQEENENNIFIEEAKAQIKDISDRITAGDTNRRLLDLLDETKRELEYRQKASYEAGEYFGRAQNEEELQEITHKVNLLQIDIRRIEEEKDFYNIITNTKVKLQNLYEIIIDKIPKNERKDLLPKTSFKKIEKEDMVDEIAKAMGVLSKENVDYSTILYLINASDQSKEIDYMLSGSYSSESENEEYIGGSETSNEIIDTEQDEINEIMEELVDDVVDYDYETPMLEQHGRNDI